MKKFLCVFLCACFVLGMLFPVSAAAPEDISNSESNLIVTEGSEVIATKNMSTGIVSYSTFDYEVSATTNAVGVTGAVSEGWFPNANEFELEIGSTNSVIKPDGRKKVDDTEKLPYSAICYIEIVWPNKKTSVGTAWMIYSDVAITAGHCVYSSENGGWAEKIKLWPGKDGYGLWNNPYGTTEMTYMHTSTEWTDSGNEEYDWAVLELEDNIGDKTGWLGFGWTSADMSGTEVTISGYPKDYQYYQYKMSDEITRCTTNKLYYNVIDTSGGQSGSPIYTSSYVSYGIHCYGLNANNENSGTRITEWRFNYFKSFKD